MSIPQDINDKIITPIITEEGSEYTNDPSDSGGPTKYGITLHTLCAYRGKPDLTAADVAALEEPEAREIYFERYVVSPGFAGVYDAAPDIGFECIDAGVNQGVTLSATYLQRCLNALNLDGELYADIAVDGEIGDATMVALRAYLQHRGDEGKTVLLKALNCLHGARYVELTEANAKDEKFLYGWLNARIHL